MPRRFNECHAIAQFQNAPKLSAFASLPPGHPRGARRFTSLLGGPLGGTARRWRNSRSGTNDFPSRNTTSGNRSWEISFGTGRAAESPGAASPIHEERAWLSSQSLPPWERAALVRCSRGAMLPRRPRRSLRQTGLLPGPDDYGGDIRNFDCPIEKLRGRQLR